MSSYVIRKEHLADYLERLKTKAELWVPVSKDGMAQFSSYDNHENLDFTVHTRVSAKSFFLPQRELMFRYSTNDKEGSPEQVAPGTRKVVFGIKPCDARAIMLNTRVMVNSHNDSVQDVFFRERLENTILVGFGCNQPGSACFCTSCGGDPFGDDGLDALITDIGNQLLLTLIADRSKSALLVENDMMTEASEEECAAAKIVSDAARDALSATPPLVKTGSDSKTFFELPVWEETAQRCMNCGICTYLCPTCTCFDMLDEATEGCGKTYRCWDSCMFSLFTQHASGHNPRPGKKERLRQRFMHKLKYFPDRYNGEVSCVGCGRCVLYCPVNIDIREVSRLMT